MAASHSTSYEHHLVDASPLRIHYVDVPSPQRPLILLHGIGMDWRVWQAVSRRLRPHFRLLMLDLRGHGESDKPVSGYSIADYAADVEDVIDALDLHNAVLVGSSLGGMVAAAVEAPTDVVGHRVLVDPPMTGGPVRDPGTFQAILRLKKEPVPALIEFLRASNPGAGQHLLRSMSEMWHEAADGVIEEMLAHADDYFAIDGALRANDAPTLLLQADPAMGASLTAEGARRGLALLSHGSHRVVHGAGHAIHATKPEEFTSIILDFSKPVE
jgi:3-oxoadipate enol-lactonase